MAHLVKSETRPEDKNRWGTTWLCHDDATALYGRPFQLDVCAEYNRFWSIDKMHGIRYMATAKCEKFFMLPWTDALEEDWVNDWWCNPPFDSKSQFIEKAVEQANNGRGGMMLLPYEPLTTWWIDLITPNATVIYEPSGRYNFYDIDGITAKTGVNFGSVFVLFTPHRMDVPMRIPFKKSLAPRTKAQKAEFAAIPRPYGQRQQAA